MEEVEAAKSPLLFVKEIKHHHNNNGHVNAYNSSDTSSSSSVTFVVVFSAVVVYCGSFALGNVIGYSSPAESGILNELGLTLSEYSFFVSIFVIGSIIGGIWSGKVADVIGRRGALGVSNLSCITGWLAIAFSQGPWCLDVGRFLVGYGMGYTMYTVPVYVAEITSKDVRGIFMSVTPLLGLLFIPDSPRWLMKINQFEKSQNALYRFRGDKADISQELADIKDYLEYSKRTFGDGILSLFQKKYAHCLIIGVGLMAFGQFGGITGTSFYASTILDSAGFSSKIGSIVIGVSQMSAIGTCLGCVLLGLSFFLQNLQFGEKHIPVLVLASLLVYFCCYGIGIESIPWIIVSEIIPINIKGPAGSIMIVVSSISAWIVSYSFRFIFEWNSSGTFFIFAGIVGVSILFIWKMVPETKGRTLEELQASITNSPQ
ncbi:Sugar/inositol transporter [Trema orientale]|uniref:Sugar/inositol transporter n=1 Tax=Trema orientale TaxID=63057 RepID=A0A2P5EJ03_TREOI|nr:Sugar/inositol transporter [Trema orientale]